MHRVEHARRGPAVGLLGPHGHRGIWCTKLGGACKCSVEPGAGDGGSDPYGDADG